MTAQNEFNSLLEVISYFKDEKTCLQYLEHWLWEDSMNCPYCSNGKTYRLKNRPSFKCSECKKHFTAKTGTIFENTKIPMVKWMTAIYLIGAHKKGVSSHQLARDLGVTQKTAWFMLHRIRKSINQDGWSRPQEGVVQVDETFVGGKNKNRHKSKKVDYSKIQGREYSDKTPVMGLLKQGGKLKTVVVPNTSIDTLLPILLNNVKMDSIVVTDEWIGYRKLVGYYDHQIVNHARKQYVNDSGATTNSIEGFWTHMKRSINGIYHHVSRKHLQRYAEESTFRYNTRKMNQGDRFGLMISKSRHRLTYKQLIYE